MVRCRFCKKPLKHTFVDLGLSPVANTMIPFAKADSSEVFYPLHTYICESCLLVQLPNTVDRSEIFNSSYTYFSSFSDTWLKHANDYVDMMTDRFHFNQNSFIIELASNDGYLLQYFQQKNIPNLGIEPSGNVAEAARKKSIQTLVEFFGITCARKLASEHRHADLIIANNVLAHVPDINDFIGGIEILLKPGGVVTLEFPHLINLIEHNEFDTIYHEHYSYFSFTTVEKIFAHHGITLFDVDEIPTHGGSLRIYGRHTENSSIPVATRVHDLKKREHDAGYTSIKRYVSFVQKVEETKRSLLQFLIQAKREGKKIVGYGAAAKGNTLLNYCGVRGDFIDYVVDRSPHKQNHFLPGTRIPVYAPERITDTKPDYILILPWNLKTEISSILSFIRDWGGKFVVAIPETVIF